jgi:hypothetical protein
MFGNNEMNTRNTLILLCLVTMLGCIHQPDPRPQTERIVESHPGITLDHFYLPSVPFIPSGMDPIALGVFRLIEDATRAGDPEGLGVTIDIDVPGAIEGDYTAQWPTGWSDSTTIQKVTAKDYLDCVTGMAGLDYSIKSYRHVVVQRRRSAEPAR